MLDQKQFLDSLLEAIPFPIFYTNLDGSNTGSNGRLKTLWCDRFPERPEICNLCASVEIPFCKKVWEGTRSIFEGDSRQAIHEFQHNKGEEQKQYLLHTAKYEDRNEEVAGAIGVIVDISHFKEHEKRLAEAKTHADRANNAKSAFLATMSHEIRTPLNGIIGMTGLMVDTPMDESQLEYVETIRASGETLLNLINDILDFSKIEADRIELENIPLNVENLVCEILDMLSKQAHLEDVDLAYRVDPDVKTEIYGDPVRLKQVLVNLVSNAVKFTEKGSIIVSIEKDPLAKNRIGISVADTGIGIHPNRVQVLFDPFVQEDSSTTRRFGGSGLGLAISKRLVAAMGGELTVQSEVGKGSVFRFSLPIGTAIERYLPITPK